MHIKRLIKILWIIFHSQWKIIFELVELARVNDAHCKSLTAHTMVLCHFIEQQTHESIRWKSCDYSDHAVSQSMTKLCDSGGRACFAEFLSINHQLKVFESAARITRRIKLLCRRERNRKSLYFSSARRRLIGRQSNNYSKICSVGTRKMRVFRENPPLTELQ